MLAPGSILWVSQLKPGRDQVECLTGVETVVPNPTGLSVWVNNAEMVAYGIGSEPVRRLHPAAIRRLRHDGVWYEVQGTLYGTTHTRDQGSYFTIIRPSPSEDHLPELPEAVRRASWVKHTLAVGDQIKRQGYPGTWRIIAVGSPDPTCVTARSALTRQTGFVWNYDITEIRRPGQPWRSAAGGYFKPGVGQVDFEPMVVGELVEPDPEMEPDLPEARAGTPASDRLLAEGGPSRGSGEPETVSEAGEVPPDASEIISLEPGDLLKLSNGEVWEVLPYNPDDWTYPSRPVLKCRSPGRHHGQIRQSDSYQPAALQLKKPGQPWRNILSMLDRRVLLAPAAELPELPEALQEAEASIPLEPGDLLRRDDASIWRVITPGEWPKTAPQIECVYAGQGFRFHRGDRHPLRLWWIFEALQKLGQPWRSVESWQGGLRYVNDSGMPELPESVSEPEGERHQLQVGDLVKVYDFVLRRDYAGELVRCQITQLLDQNSGVEVLDQRARKHYLIFNTAIYFVLVGEVWREVNQEANPEGSMPHLLILRPTGGQPGLPESVAPGPFAAFLDL